MCDSNNSPAGIATQKPALRARLDVAAAAQRLAAFYQCFGRTHVGEWRVRAATITCRS